MTSLTFWFFFSRGGPSAATTEMVKKNNKQENKSIKYVKQIESICLWALGEPKEQKKKVLNTFFWGSSLLRSTNFSQIVKYDISCWNLSEFMFKIKGSDFPLRVLVACCY